MGPLRMQQRLQEELRGLRREMADARDAGDTERNRLVALRIATTTEELNRLGSSQRQRRPVVRRQVQARVTS